MKTITANPGESIDKAAERAVEAAKQYNEPVLFVFNDTEVVVYPQSYAQDIAEKCTYKRYAFDMARGFNKD